MATEYKLLLSDKFDKTFIQLDRTTQNRIAERLKDLPKNPALGKTLKGKLKDLRSLRVGKYRILYQVQNKRLIILVLAVGHRKRIYE